MRKMVVFFISIIFGFIPLSAASSDTGQKKILYIDSYHEEYIWSADITAGIKSVLMGRSDVELRIFRLDTKRNQSEEYKIAAALKAKQLIESWHPDVVIASDDNASKYLIVPYFKNKELPFVFCGLNWDASVYGFPAENITGMVEVALYESTIEVLRGFAKGKRIGYLASDTESERKEYENITNRFGDTFTVRFAKTFDELKKGFLELQTKTDLVLIQECRSVAGFDHRQMVEFVRRHTQVPTGAMQKYLVHYALLSLAKIGEEQGEYAARTALEILEGRSPADIPVVANRRARTYLNMKIAKTLGVKFPIELIANGHLISAEQKKVLYVNSYHSGYEWSDKIEKGIFKALNITLLPDGSLDTTKSDVDLKIIRMDTKRNVTEEFKKKAALQAKTVIEQWHPDLVITSDDNAVKYLAAEYYRNSDIPFVFCGVNLDASVYGLPSANMTGIVEVTPVRTTITMLREYAAGDRLGYIGGDVLSEQEDLNYLRDSVGLDFSDGALVTSFAEWEQVYTRLQETVDMLLWLSPAGIKGWDYDKAREFVMEHTRIPTGAIASFNIRLALLGRVKVAEEQGWWAGNTALSILEGTLPADIPVARNKQSVVYLNMRLARKLGVKFPMAWIEEAEFVEDVPR
ncbi:ABC transporter substrate-binding protein [Desulfopila sp. IMCC35008]|uniref:ABC transporter substrate-binding protein n=1 Tax=Desulfopila sp. IMCC35008 TaxID=2653858 RepID=UPI0013D03CB0|nr:ABC transporter substrate binding protein [Desulfopila sp. IMCC35008]